VQQDLWPPDVHVKFATLSSLEMLDRLFNPTAYIFSRCIMHSFVLKCKKKNKHERSLVLFFHIGPHKYNKRCAALGIQFNSISRRLFVTSRRYHAQYHSSNPPTSISNSRQSDSYHYLDESPISEIPCSQNSKNVVRKLTPCLKKLCIFVSLRTLSNFHLF